MSHKGLSCCHSSFTSNSHLPPSSSRGGRQSPNDSPRLCKVSLFMVSVVTCPCIFYVKKSGTFLPIKDPNQNREEIHPMPRGESAMISVLVQQLYLNPLPVTQPANPFIDGNKVEHYLLLGWPHSLVNLFATDSLDFSRGLLISPHFLFEKTFPISPSQLSKTIKSGFYSTYSNLPC